MTDRPVPSADALASLVLRPLDPVAASDAGDGALPLAGGPLFFSRLDLLARDGGKVDRLYRGPAGELSAWLTRKAPDLMHPIKKLLESMTTPRRDFAGLSLAGPRLMGIINVTPDSFSDGGDRFDAGRAIADGLEMRDAGADILDVGGESTRPGADSVPEDEELRRVVPVVRGLARAGALVSIDTRHARVMAAALEAGAIIVNDVTALTGNRASLSLVAEAQAPVVLMHMQGEPQSMQRQPSYDDAALDIYDFLRSRIDACEAAGLSRSAIAVDPGIGFGKTLEHNLQLLDRVGVLHGLGCAILIGASRKSFIGRLAPAEQAKDRLPGSLSAALAAVSRGVQLLRVHDVGETRQALAVWQAIIAQAVESPAEAAQMSSDCHGAGA